VLINQFLTMYSMNAGGMMPVLVRTLNTTVDAAESARIVNSSLLHVPTDEILLTLVPQADGAKKVLSAVSLRGGVAAAPQPVAHLNSRGGKAPSAKALKVKKQPQFSNECQEALVALRKPEQQRAAAKCEEDNKMPTQVIDHLQKAQKAEAEAVTKQAFEQCAKMAPECAAQVAPSVVQELRMNGVALSQECKEAVNKAQGDKAAMKEVRKCEKTEGVAKKMMGSLNNEDVDGAVDAAGEGLEKCMKLSKECSFQVAPVLINQFLTMYSMNAGGMMPVLVRTLNTTVDAVESARIVNSSLLHVPTDEILLTLVPQAEGAKKVLSAVSLRGVAAALQQK
jgi:enhancing lycopene biosynthesis protein 2